MGEIPNHVGYIMDGNGRWAKARNKPRNYGHIKGADVIEEVVEETFEKGVKVVSLYAFSTENWSRPKEECDQIFEILRKFLVKYSKKLQKDGIRLVISGDISALPNGLGNECLKQIELTEKNERAVLNIAINYGSKAEIIRACNAVKEKGLEITEKTVSENLYTAGLPDIDLIVRTSGEQRISNFFLWQSAYSELYFTDVLWPDFHKSEVDKALEWYKGRKRRFGKVDV